MLRLQSVVTFLLFIAITLYKASAQTNASVLVDSKGILRWKETGKEAAFFGVNYTVPFAYGYRSHLALGINPELAIKQDVYHMARLGIDAFRVHVWDTEITDTAGNLLLNEHLRLFDFLISELKSRKIKTLITPIAFWGNGYPEKDEKTPGFATKYGKLESVANENAIKAQENYLKQFLKHKNPYTGLTYLEDADIIAAEINNEPVHSGTKNFVTNYVNRLSAAVRSTGWTKPVFYNISESPTYADAVANSNIDGVSFQWYPTGLVANRTLKGNFLPNVDKYHIPFDTIPAFKNKARMVYEFDAGDVLQPIMYPAMARSFRTAGFQWATQFAYDPMATGYANTEYQTHFLNLAYTPQKAISLLIANKVFHQVPLNKSYGTYPNSSVFENFRIDYESELSEMNSAEEFYYSNTTSSRPTSPAKLKNIAGVGSSPIVRYSGSGAYFLDKLATGLWRLEVMPDAVLVNDPFAKASPKKEVVRIDWQQHKMSVSLQDLGTDFYIKGLNSGNKHLSSALGNDFVISPGSYLLSKGSSKSSTSDTYGDGRLKLNEFVAPAQMHKDIALYHQPPAEISSGKDLRIKATIAGQKKDDKVTLQLNQLGGRWKTITMTPQTIHEYSAVIPAEFVEPGVLMYKIIVSSAEESVTFPGSLKGNPWAWDNHVNETWKVNVAAPDSDIEIYDANRNQFVWSQPNRDANLETRYRSAGSPYQLVYSMIAKDALKDNVFGFQTYVGDRIEARKDELKKTNTVVLRARGIGAANIKISLITLDGVAYSATIASSETLSDIEIPLTSFRADSALLLPRPYPGFQPLKFKAASKAVFNLTDIEKLAVTTERSENESGKFDSCGFEIESVRLRSKSR